MEISPIGKNCQFFISGVKPAFLPLPTFGKLAIVGAEMRAAKPKATKARSFSVSLPPELFGKATKLAFKRHKSFSGLVRELLAAELEGAK
jgi:hypothetical protein